MIAITDELVTDRLAVETAEREIIAAAVIAPEWWERLRIVRPDWFGEWADQQLWRALQFVADENDGVALAPVVEEWLRQTWPDEAESLLERLNLHCAGWVSPAHLDFHLRVLAQTGERRAIGAWCREVMQHLWTAPRQRLVQMIAAAPICEGEVRE